MNPLSHRPPLVAPEPQLVRLCELHTGQSGWIAGIIGGWQLRQSLNQVGIHTGDFFKVERAAHLGGPVLITIHSSQVALGNGMSQKIMVRFDDENQI